MVSAVRLIIALNIYEKRNGELPDKLGQLVPEYVDAVPRDPYDGKPFRYDRDKEIVYSAGKNLKDEGGSLKYAYRGDKLKVGRCFSGEDYLFGIRKNQFPRTGSD